MTDLVLNQHKVGGLPHGWSEAPLGDVTTIVSGSTPKTGVAEYWGGDVAWITPDDLSRNRSKTIAFGARSLTQAGFDSCSTRVMPPGSVLYSSRAPIGYAAITTDFICTNQGFKSFVPSDVVTSDYLYWFLVHATPLIRKLGSGTTFPELSKKSAAGVQLPLPPLNEQRRIVAAIEEHLSRLDAADASLAAATSRTGVLRERASAETMSGNWPTVPLGEIADIAGGVTKDSKRQSDPAFVEVPYLRVANVQRGFLDLSEVTYIRVPPTKAASLALRPGDVLFNEGGDRDKLGRGWVWSGEIEGCIHQNHVFRARLNEDFEPKFVSWHGNTFGRQWFEAHGRQTTNLASLNLTTLRSFPVPAAPLPEQRRIVARIEEQLSGIDALRAAIERAQRRSASLRRAVLEQAFRGELVPQDPSDEPADQLLARIRAERNATPMSRRTNKVD